MWLCKALWEIINIQQKIYLGPNEHLLILIKRIIRGNDLKVKAKVREAQGVPSTHCKHSMDA
jgi:hypothetical protein